MAQETNEISPRGTRAETKQTRKVWARRLLKAAFWAVWVIDKALRLVAWLSGGGDE